MNEVERDESTNAELRITKPEAWVLRLYVAGQMPKTVKAFTNLKRICEEKLQGEYSIEIVDVANDPQQAREDQIVALPTLVRKVPPPLRKIIGDLSDEGKVLAVLELEEC